VSGPDLSVVIASVNGQPYLSRCLESLEERAPNAEIIVADWTDESTRRQVGERFKQTRLISFREPMAVPELRAAGIEAAKGRYVAVIEDHCVIRDGWADRLVRAHDEGHPVVGGPIRNGATERIRDWAAFFCEYSAHMAPSATGPTDSLVGMNVSYDRDAIAAMADLLREGRWETWLHPRLRSQGFAFFCDGEAQLDHVKDFGFKEFLSQRYHYARSHAGMRNAELGPKRLAYCLGTPLLVPMLYKRIAGNVFRKRRHRKEFLAATPLILVYLTVWAAGEAVGYAIGGGRSLLKVR
jgi:glycosyltransferase involved in cell wall biosynthesis